MKKYIYTARNGIYIIDLAKTAEKIEEAYTALKKIVDNGGKVLFVGTKKQCQDIVKEEALRSGSFYVNTRWLGGTLTNFRTIAKRIAYLRDLEKKDEEGYFDNLPKKEATLYRKEMEKLEKFLVELKKCVVYQMQSLSLIHVLNVTVLEARKLKFLSLESLIQMLTKMMLTL